MRDRFEGQWDSGADRSKLLRPLNAADWGRLEEVGDLHFHASAYSSALDYYRQLCDSAVLGQMPVEQALRVLRKSVDSTILIGDFNQVDLLLDRADEMLAVTGQLADPDLSAVNRAIFQTRRAIALRERGRLNDALNLSKKAFAVLAMTDLHADVAVLQVGMGICYMRLGRLAKAEEFYNDGLSTFRRIGNDLGVANLLNNLALLNKIRCRWDKALDLMDRAVELAHTIGASHLLPGFYLNKGIILQKTNRLGESRAQLDKGLRLATSLGDRMRRTRLLLALGRLETLSGRLARAEELLLDGKANAEENGFLREATIADEYLGDVILGRGDWDKALYNYQIGLEKSKQIASGNDLEGELLRRMAEAHLLSGDLDKAVAFSQASIAVCEKCGEAYEVGFCHLTLGRAYARMDDRTQSDHHFRQAIAVFSEQGLTHLWCQAILDFAEYRLASAKEAELLLLRRYLMDAQENGASSVSDQMLCRVLRSLGLVQIRLEQFDDALLTVFELERYAAGFDDADLDKSVVELRDTIESGLLGGVTRTQSHLGALSALPGLYARSDQSVPRNLGSVLMAGLEKVQADSGFIAMVDGDDVDSQTTIAARHGLTENLCLQLTRWFDRELATGNREGTSLFSRLDAANPLARAVPAVIGEAESCVFMPIALHERRFGLLFLANRQGGVAGTPGFDRSSLDFLATYMGFLALFLHEKGRGNGDAAEATPIERVESFENIITQNVKMLEVLGLARKVAPSNLTVLLNGETGTGKGLLAYSIHALSKRSDKKFLAINCAAIPESLLESELFGHKKGSFTGAYSDKRGLLAEAEGGTVFLDEVGKMSLGMQGKLLHFLDTKVVRPVGSNVEFAVDVRVLCASKSDLHEMSRQGLFLEDLYYRLLDFPLLIPPLRERVDDIGLLARHFVERFSHEMEMEAPEVDRAFLQMLQGHDWPGNVRELEKVLKRAIVLARGDRALRGEHLPDGFSPSGLQAAVPGSAVPPLKETLAGIECQEIARAMRVNEGNKSATARMLKISYPNLLKKIRHYGLDR
ncbi:sigma 54-interacting transcriptional regulator [bacterium]|nr:sigma 54-interacting transcriptional regulator [bacterium]